MQVLPTLLVAQLGLVFGLEEAGRLRWAPLGRGDSSQGLFSPWWTLRGVLGGMQVLPTLFFAQLCTVFGLKEAGLGGFRVNLS